jgi:peptidoglycan/LPS O-acetylase OafA/YrhL
MSKPPNDIVDLVESSAPKTTGTVYYKQLDGLRAFAVLCTMVTHFTHSKEGWLRFIPWGQTGVRLFFVLSGFLITGIILKYCGEHDRRSFLKGFYARRMLRIFPVYYCTLAIALCLNISHIRSAAGWHALYLSNVYAAIYNPPNGSATHFWSLSVEEQFYLIWPCLLLFLPDRWLRGAIVAAACSGPAFRLVCVFSGISNWATLAPFGCFDTLGGGALLAWFADPRFGNPVGRRRFSVFCLWTGLPLVCLFLYINATNPSSRGAIVWSDTALSLLFIWLIDAATRPFRGLAGYILEWKPIAYMGRISYGVYVLHAFMPVVLFYTLKLAGVSIPDGSTAWFVILVLMSITAASVSWNVVERPLNSLKRFFPYAASNDVRKRGVPEERYMAKAT